MRLTFFKGQRVRLSHEAKRANLHRWAKQVDRIGTVVRHTAYGVSVIWDGNKPGCPPVYHPDYVAHADDATVTNGERQ